LYNDLIFYILQSGRLDSHHWISNNLDQGIPQTGFASLDFSLDREIPQAGLAPLDSSLDREISQAGFASLDLSLDREIPLLTPNCNAPRVMGIRANPPSPVVIIISPLHSSGFYHYLEFVRILIYTFSLYLYHQTILTWQFNICNIYVMCIRI
jgi:hypothetical protein